MKYFLLSLIITIAAKGYAQGLDNALKAMQSKTIGKVIEQKSNMGYRKLLIWDQLLIALIRQSIG